MKKITSLTDEQKARFGEWSERWIQIGLSTEPADFEAATEAALKGYKLANHGRPMVVLRMGSPYAATVGGAMAWMMLRSIFKDQVWAQVWAQVRAQVGAQVWAAVRDGYSNFGYDALWGTGFAAWVSFFRDVCGWQDPILEKFEVLETLVKSCGWTWWHQNVLAISDRPRVINRDDQNRLHCETGPSISYPDGWSLYHWHGVAIPGEWVTGSKPSAKEALKWENMEQRRAACEIVGWAAILRELKAKVINADSDPEIGTLVECELPDAGKERFLRVQCGTGREFALCVPPTMKTAREANSWTYSLPAKELQPEVRT